MLDRLLPRGQKGQGLVEYGLVLSLVSMLVIGLVAVFGTQVYGLLTGIIAALP